MLILCKGDQHLRDKKPRGRKDDFYAAQMAKHDFIFNYALENKIDVILQPGDFFDSPNASFKLIIDYLDKRSILSPYAEIPEIATYGQHDLFFHSNKDKNKTPLHFLYMTGYVKCEKRIDLNEDVHVYSAAWGEDIPEIVTEGTNILITHRMVINDDKVWESQEDYERAKHLLRSHSYDLIVTGDNHTHFRSSYRSRILLNPGSIMRSSISQRGHKPCFYVYDTDEKKATRVDIPVEEDVFVEKEDHEIGTDDEKLSVFIEGLQNDNVLDDISFVKNLQSVIDKSPSDVVSALLTVIKRSGLNEQFNSGKTRKTGNKIGKIKRRKKQVGRSN